MARAHGPAVEERPENGVPDPSDALDDPDAARRGGRYAKAAQQIDLRITTIRAGSTDVCFLVTGGEADAQVGLFPQLPGDLPTQALARVLDDIQKESQGHLVSALARDYLRALPRGVTSHDYDLRQDGVSVKRVQVQESRLPEVPPALSYTSKITGYIVALGFEPGTVTIRDGSDRKSKITCSATEEQIATAIDLRSRDVVAMCVSTGDAKQSRPRLLWLRDATSPPVAPDEDTRAARFLEDWRETLAILAR